MKQQITVKQWDELSDGEKVDFLNCLGNGIDIGAYWNGDVKLEVNKLPNGFQLIEYLGDDCHRIEKSCDDWIVYVPANKGYFLEEFMKKELIDALWMAIVYKLRQKDG